MATQRYSVTPHPIETLLTWVKSGEIAIPEIQRPFVWDATKVRNLLDSLYQGYPVGYHPRGDLDHFLMTWCSPYAPTTPAAAPTPRRHHSLAPSDRRSLSSGNPATTTPAAGA
jgi:hypothetical protein